MVINIDFWLVPAKLLSLPLLWAINAMIRRGLTYDYSDKLDLRTGKCGDG